jgi:hypothetical protein
MYKTSFKNILKANKLVFLGGVGMPLILYLVNNFEYWYMFLTFSLLLNSGFFIAFYIKFKRCNIQSFSIDDKEVTLIRSNGEKITNTWDELKLVWDSEQTWTFEPINGSRFSIYQEFFDPLDWEIIGEQIRKNRKINADQLRSPNPSISPDPGSDLIIKAEYDPKIFLPVIITPIIGVLFLIGFIADLSKGVNDPEMILEAVFILIMFSLPLGLVKRFILSNEIIIEKYFLPRKFIRYEDITDITDNFIYTKLGKVPIPPLKNLYYLVEALKEKKRKGFYSESQFKKEGLFKEILTLAAGLPTFILSVLFYMVLQYFHPIEDVHPQIAIIVLFTVLYPVVYLILKAFPDNSFVRRKAKAFEKDDLSTT